MINGNDRSSRLVTCIASAKNFMLSPSEARQVIDGQVSVIKGDWGGLIDEAILSPVDQALFRKRLFLNDYAFESYDI